MTKLTLYEQHDRITIALNHLRAMQQEKKEIPSCCLTDGETACRNCILTDVHYKCDSVKLDTILATYIQKAEMRLDVVIRQIVEMEEEEN